MHWALALVNASPLPEAHQQELNNWLKSNDIDPISCVECSEEPLFKRFHDASPQVLPCLCLTYTFLRQEKNKF